MLLVYVPPAKSSVTLVPVLARVVASSKARPMPTAVAGESPIDGAPIPDGVT
jgi:hypothetical protein